MGSTMKKLMILALSLGLAGCTTVALEHHTVSQSQSATNYRYHAALHCLAMVAADPGTLPSYALLSSGVTAVTDSGVVNPVTAWKGNPMLFASEAMAVTGSHIPQIQWTVSPVADHTQLQAMRCACRWVLCGGPSELCPDCMHILADPETDASPGAHFGVADRLTRLPHGWLHVGKLREVPVGARYKAHSGDTWVWVMPDGMEGLSGFTLVLQDIATLAVTPSDNGQPANRTPPLLVTLWVTQNALPPVFVNIEKEKQKDGTTALVLKPKDVVVGVGQYVVWQNKTSEQIKIAGPKKKKDGMETPDDSLFQITIKKSPASEALLFDQAMFSSGGGKPGNDPVIINYRPTTDITKGDAGTITLKTDPNRSAFTSTTVFRVDREIKPEFKHAIEQKMIEGIDKKGALQPVNISWEEWMAMTTPFQGARTSVKPGASTTTPTFVPSSRSSPPAIVMPQRGQPSPPPPKELLP